jgi:hypothetical protein
VVVPVTVDRRTRDDAGSTLVIAVTVMFVLSSLALAGLARTLSAMASVRTGQDYAAALAVADAGLNDALYRLDAGMPDEAGWTSNGTSGPGTYHYRTTRISPEEYLVESRGDIGRTRHGLRASVVRGPSFALFADDRLDIGGGAGTLGLSASSFNAVGGADTNQVNVGSNTSITVGPGADAGDAQHTYGDRQACSGCTNWVRHDRRYPLPPVVAPTGTTQACPLTGTFTGAVDGQHGTPFVCRRDVVLTGTVTVLNGPFVLYVLPDVDGSGVSHDHSLDLTTALVNPLGRATNAQLYKAGSAPLRVDLNSTPTQLTFSGLLYAPQSELTIQGSKWWTGSLIVRRVKVNGTPVVTFGFDLDLERLGHDWTVGKYAEIPSSQVHA